MTLDIYEPWSDRIIVGRVRREIDYISPGLQIEKIEDNESSDYCRWRASMRLPENHVFEQVYWYPQHVDDDFVVKDVKDAACKHIYQEIKERGGTWDAVLNAACE